MKKKDIEKFKRGLTDAQKDEWLKVFTTAFKEAVKEGLADLDAEVKAIRKANALFSDKKIPQDFANPLHRTQKDKPLELVLAEAGDNEDFQLVLPIGLTYSDWYREIIVTRKYCEALYANQHVLKNTIPFLDTEHDRGQSNGWLLEMRVTDEGLEVKWDFTDRGRDLLQRKIYRYYSASLYTVMDIETGQYLWPVFVGAALTNSPVMKQLPEAHLADADQKPGTDKTFSAHGDGASQSDQGDTMDLSKLIAAAMELSDADKAKLLAALGNKDTSEENKVLSETNKNLSERVNALTVENAKMKKDAQELAVIDTLSKALSDGKIKPADKDQWEKDLRADFAVYSKVLEKLPANSAVDLSGPTGVEGNDGEQPPAIDPVVKKELSAQGWSDEDIAKYAGGAA